MEVLKILVLVMVSSPCSTGTVLPCDEKVYAELGERASIDCYLSDIGNVFWYSGKTAFDIPIVKLENGRKTISDGDRSRYDISETGALIINEVTKNDFDQYKILHVLIGRPIEEAVVTLQRPIAPKRSCPQIGECFDCRKCVIKDTDTITCSVSGSRPSVNFTFHAINMTHVTNTTTKIQYDNSSETWTTSSTINIHSRSCNMSLNLSCNVEGDYPFELSDSYANVQLDTCSGIQRKEPRENPSSDPANHTAITIIFLLFLVIVFLVAAGCIIKRRRQHNMKIRLIRHLEDQCSKLSFITPMPWDDPIHIEKLYTPTTFKLIGDGNDDDEEEWESDKFLQSSKLDSFKRALFKAELGNGKTTLQKYLAWQWSKKTQTQKQQKLLFFLEVKDINMGLAEALCGKIPTDLNIKCDDILHLLKTVECQIVMYGLEAISDTNEDTGEQQRSAKGDIQIKRVLADPVDNAYPNLQILVTSSELDKVVPCFSKPYAEINMNIFSKEQWHKYIKLVSKIYESSDSDRSQSCQDNVAMVEQHLDDNDLIKNFSNCPLLMCMFIHILFVKKTYLAKHKIDITKYSSLVGGVVYCLVVKYKQTYLKSISNDSDMDKHIKEIKIQLGMVSLPQDEEKINSTWEVNKLERCLGKNALEIAVKIGFLKRTSENSIDDDETYSTLNRVKFFNSYVQDFLIAEYIVDTNGEQLKRLRKMLRTDDGAKVASVLQFVCGKSKDTMIREIIEFIVDERLWNVFIDCLHEVRDDVKEKVLTTKTIKTALSTKDVEIAVLERRYHQNAVLEFCNLCQVNKITLTTMCFNGLVPDSFVKELTLPTMKQLILQKTTFDIDDTVTTLIEKATKDNSVETLRFLECTLPERITLSDNLRETCLNSKCKVIKSEHSDSTDQLVLNFRTGKWKWN